MIFGRRLFVFMLFLAVPNGVREDKPVSENGDGEIEGGRKEDSDSGHGFGQSI